MYVSRSLERPIIAAIEQSPVVIVEGARAVGKTSLMTHLRDRGVLAATPSLVDETTLHAARTDPEGWIRSLPQPFAIDEAQRAPGLPMAIKAMLDADPGSLRCVLTGSASLGLSGLDGSDPLARRSVRFTLEPLTESELLEDAPAEGWSVVDELVRGEPVGSWGDPAEDRGSAMSRGGLPFYRLGSGALGRLTARRVRDDMRAVLSESVLPDERMDERIAMEVLQRLLREPAALANVSKIASDVGVTAPTINRYLDILERRFLLTELPNLTRSPRRTPRSTAKLYPADVALSVFGSPDAVHDVSDRFRGAVVEAIVAQQLRAHMGWSEFGEELLHWRANVNGRTVEVDLVVRATDGSLIPIEVKSGTSVSGRQLAGIRHFREQNPRSAERAFVVYGGDTTVLLGESVWAIPLGALCDRSAWKRPDRTERGADETTHRLDERMTMNEGSVPELPDARVFISYAHADQNGRYTGDLRGFAQDVVDTMANVHDRVVRTFIDVEQGTWGEDLWGRLEREESIADFMIPFITPAYLRSDGCRREYLGFMARREAAAARSTLLPLIWLEPRGLYEPGSTDPIRQDLIAHRGVPVGVAHDADPDSAEYRRVLREITDRLADVLDATATTAQGGAEGAGEAAGALVDDRPALDELLAEIELSTPQLVADFESFVADFEEFGRAMQAAMVKPAAAGGTPVQAQAYFARVGKELGGGSEALLGSANAASNSWREYTALLHRAIGASAELDAGLLPDGVVEPLRELAEEIPASDIADMQSIAVQMGKMSRSLRPASEALLVSVRTFRDLAEGAELVETAWRSATDR
ncbi:DUF4143 domain-containing protein [Brachybacterium paraconglomeratum]